MCAAVQAQFDLLNNESRSYPAPGTTVTVSFVLDADGGVARILDVKRGGGASDPVAKLCTSAIVLPSPYPAWSAEMIAALGREQELTFEFVYQ